MAEHLLTFFGSYYTWGYIGFIVGSALSVYNLSRNGMSAPKAIAIVTAGIYGGLFGSRLLFLLQYDAGFLWSNWPQIFVFWQGGLAWLGGPIGAGLVFAVVFTLMKRDTWAHMGDIVPGIALSHSIARIGCLIRGCCYGRPTTVPWAVYSDVLHTHVHPTQIYSLFAEALVACILQLLHRNQRSRKYLFPLYLALLSTHRLIIEQFRGDAPGPAVFPHLRFYQSVCVLLLLSSLVALMLIWKGPRLASVAAASAAGLVALAVLLQPQRPQLPTPSAANEGKTLLVATRELFRLPLERYLNWRQQQGWTVELKAWAQPPAVDEIHSWLTAGTNAQADAVLLVGDSEHVPSPLSPENAPHDAAYGDLDSDSLPDRPVGRIPVRDASQLAIFINKVQDYEIHLAQQRDNPQKTATSTRSTVSTRSTTLQVLVWAGVPENEPAVEDLKQELKHKVQGQSPIGLSLIDGSNPRDEPYLFLEALSRPYNFSLIVSEGYVDRVITAGKPSAVELSASDLSQLSAGRAGGIMAILACETGLFTSVNPPACLAEEFLFHPAGPVAVIATGEKVRRPTNLSMACAVADILTAHEPPATVGEFLLLMQKTAANPDPPNPQDATSLAAIIQSRMPQIDPHDARPLEVYSYNLLGDPVTPF